MSLNLNHYWEQIGEKSFTQGTKNSCEMLVSYCNLFLLLEYLTRDFSAETVQVHFPREFILELLSRHRT